MKEMKDYAHLYLGCKAILTNEDGEQKKFILNAYNLNYYRDYLSDVKLILRPLELMTAEEQTVYAQIGDYDFNKSYKRDDFYLIDKMTADQVVWALRMGFDMFNLKEAGLAVCENENI